MELVDNGVDRFQQFFATNHSMHKKTGCACNPLFQNPKSTSISTGSRALKKYHFLIQRRGRIDDILTLRTTF